MESDDVREALRAAERSFERMPETIEEGLDVDDPELVQLRRACRLLSAGSMLLDRGFGRSVSNYDSGCSANHSFIFLF